MKRIIYIFFIILLVSGNLKAEFLDFGTIILGRPTNSSISGNVLAKKSLEFYIEYGSEKNQYKNKSEVFKSTYPEPVEFKLSGLEANTRYYYRIQFRENSSLQYQASSEYTFHTQRTKGSSFKFTIQSDAHLYDKKGIKSVMDITMDNQTKDSADFILDLGDTFGDDHEPFTITSDKIKQLHLDYLPFFGKLCHSSPLFLCLGNHEGESGYYLQQTPPNNLAVYATKWRTKYYPNPYPDGFYTGNEDIEANDIGRPQNYYAFEWGDALFVIMDVYRYYTVNEKPKKWDWTIGDKQYFWFKNTLESSKAKFKFVFAHHTLGQGRGGVKESMLYEWGGYEDTKKSEWGFTTNRPGWSKPIHQLMVDNGVQIYFQGHDHLFAKEEIDGMVYQEVPMPSDSTYKIGMLANADAYTGLNIYGTGYLRVTVSDDEAKVDYIKSYLPNDENDSLINGMLGYSYTINSNTTISCENNKLNSILNVYPNPASEIIYLSGYEGPIKIVNILGKLIWEGFIFQNINIDISFLDTGIYYIRYKSRIINFIKL